jgi:tetratricopeptide (TPR) repeat protein
MNFLAGQKFVKQKEYGKALDFFLNLQENGIENKTIYFYLGLIYSELNNFNKSIYNYNKFLKINPNSQSALLNLAIAKQSIGEIVAAKDIYLKLIGLNGDAIGAYFGLLMLDINYLTDDHYAYIRQIEKSDKISLYEKGLINFILAKKEQVNKNYIKETTYLKNFNINSFNSNYTYNQSSQFYYKEIINNFYNKIQFTDNNINLEQDKNYFPIFIIGLPRSGSTLIESILTSGDKKIKTCAESHIINMTVLEQIGPKIYTKDFDIKKFVFNINLVKLQQSALGRYAKFKVKNSNLDILFIDKSLENFFNIEIILKVFPNARFLHTFRNSIDSVISIYQSMLPELSWTHKIVDILDYMDNYKKVINYFKTKYPKKIMDIDLENFTKESEAIGQKIYKFCDLEWNKKYLELYKRKDLYSKTISFNQIRKKISIYDTKKYKPYDNLLDEYKNKYKWLKND